MSSHLHIPVSHRRAFFEVHAAEDGVFAVTGAQAEDGLLNAAFARFGVGRGVKQAELFAALRRVEAVFGDDVAGGYADAPHQQVGVNNAVKQPQRGVGYPLGGGRIAAEPFAAVRVLGHLSAVVVGLDFALVAAAAVGVAQVLDIIAQEATTMVPSVFTATWIIMLETAYMEDCRPAGIPIFSILER